MKTMQNPRRVRSRKFSLEILEDRQLLTTWQVTNGGDTGLTTQLRYVAKEAQAGDTIVVDTNVLLTQGDINLTQNGLTIEGGEGPLPSNTVINGGGSYGTVFYQSGSANIHLENLTLTEPSGSSATCYNAFGGSTDFSDCDLTSAFDGVLVYGGDHLQLDTGTQVTNMQYYGIIVDQGNYLTIPATTGPDVVFAHNYAGVYNEGFEDGINISIANTDFADNSQWGFEEYEGDGTLTGCTFIGNGGGINLLNSSGTETVSVSNSTFEDGTGTGPALEVSDGSLSTFSGTQLRVQNNVAQSSSNLITVSGGASFTLADSMIVSNKVSGPAPYLVEFTGIAQTTLTDDAVSGNTTANSVPVGWLTSSLANASLLVDSSSFTNNTVTGGAVTAGLYEAFSSSGTAVVNNSTFFGNANPDGSTASAGAIDISAATGTAAVSDVYNDTIDYNSASTTGGIYAASSVSPEVANTIVAGSIVGGYSGADIAGNYTLNNDLVQNPGTASVSSGSSNDIYGQAPGITVLGTNLNQPGGWFAEPANMPIIAGGNVQGTGSQANIPSQYGVQSGDGLMRVNDIGADELVVPAGSPPAPQPPTAPKKGQLPPPTTSTPVIAAATTTVTQVTTSTTPATTTTASTAVLGSLTTADTNTHAKKHPFAERHLVSHARHGQLVLHTVHRRAQVAKVEKPGTVVHYHNAKV